jgi:hypothetical protein
MSAGPLLIFYESASMVRPEIIVFRLTRLG